MDLPELVNAFADSHQRDQDESIVLVLCRDCGRTIHTYEEQVNHVCLDPKLAHRYVREFRSMNAEKNQRIEDLEEALIYIKRLMEEHHGENAKFHFPYNIVCDTLG